MLDDVFNAFEAAEWPATEPMSVRKLIERRRAMRAVVARFVTGGNINLRHDMKELGSEPAVPQMRGLWSFRSGPPNEQTRLFGFFARPGAFVATSFRSRGEMPEGAWLDEKRDGEAAWKKLFGIKAFMQDPWIVTTRPDFLMYLDCPDD